MTLRASTSAVLRLATVSLVATLVALAAPVVGGFAMWACRALAVARVQSREAELIGVVTPGR